MRLFGYPMCRRITPASAGSSARGGHRPVPRTGSPPRRRVAEQRGPGHRQGQWITPASAGSRVAASPTAATQPDHPRVGGEQPGIVPLLLKVDGSPPRRRGAGRVDAHAVRDQRITPASAGSSYLSTSWRSMIADHPRVGGEQHPTHMAAPHFFGSPPHRRGAAPRPGGNCRHQRITPASAGSRRADSLHASERADHPRVGGEQPTCPAVDARSYGSPPRRRGAGVRSISRAPHRRITPASAGSRP